MQLSISGREIREVKHIIHCLRSLPGPNSSPKLLDKDPVDFST